MNEIEPDSDLVASGSLGLKSLIEQTLAQDPRPAHERGKDGKQGQYWGVMIGPAHVRFKVEGGEQFKARRLALGLRQTDMLLRVGVFRQQYQRLEASGRF